MLTFLQLRDCTPMNNLVLCKPVVNTEKITHGSLELYNDTTFHPEHHQPVIQKVIAVPKKLIYGTFLEYKQINATREIKDSEGNVEGRAGDWSYVKTALPNSMPWKTEMELLVGDIVWMNYFTVIMAEKQNRTIICEGEKYYLIPYDKIYLKKKDSTVQMLNGYILVEPIKLEKTNEDIIAERIGLKLCNDDLKLGNDKYGIVRYAGKHINEYMLDEFTDDPDITVGTTVRMAWQFNKRLEAPTHRYFSNEELIVTRRPNISATITDGLF